MIVVNDNGWIGVDLDGTLAFHEPGEWTGGIGAPIGPMVDRVKRWLAEGKRVRILTARVHPRWDRDGAQRSAVLNWVLEQFGCYLPVTHRKDPDMLELWDDRVVPVRRNTGLTDAEYTMQQMRHQRQHHQGAD